MGEPRRAVAIPRVSWVLTVACAVVALGVSAVSGEAGASQTAGLAWRAATLPALAGSGPSISSVSCPASGSCVAVGFYTDGSGSLQGLIETLANGSWTAQTAPLADLTPAAASNPSAELQNVDCPTTDFCVAVGVYSGTSNFGEGLIETYSNGAWVAATAPTADLSPAVGSSPGLDFRGLSCPAAGACAAVGQYSVSGIGHLAFTETLADGTWTDATPSLANLDPPASGSSSTLSSVSCPTSGTCAAVGSYIPTGAGAEGLIASLSSGAWSTTSAPVTGLNPAAQIAPSNQPASVSLSRVSCAPDGSCVAIGSYANTNGGQSSLFETGSATSWAASTPPSPSSSQALLNAVACPASGSCVAVGEYQDSSGNSQGLIETDSGGIWTASDAPLTGLNPAASTSPGEIQLLDLSCPAGGSCAGAGIYVDAAGQPQALMLVLTGGTWTASTAPSGDLNPPPNSFDFVQPTDVSCPANGFCSAVGVYFDTSSQRHAMAVSEVDATSTQVACIPAADDLQQATSCTATVTDLAAGGASSPSGTVTFSSDSSGTLSNASACTLSATTADASSCSLSYTPTAIGSGTHTITAAYPGDPTHGASSGTYGLTVTEPQASVTPASLNFGKVPARKTSEQTVTISDGAAATGNLIIGGIADGGASEFTIDWATSTCTDPAVTAPSLAPGQSCTVVEKFSPTRSTNAKAGVGGTLTFTDNDPTSPQTVTMTGK